MIESLTLPAALLLGLAASGHCVAMCGGIAGALGMATVRHAGDRPRLGLILGYQFGRIASYAVAGSLLGGVLQGIVAMLDVEAVRIGLRALSAAALLSAALVLLGRGAGPGGRAGRWIWPRLSPWARRFLPVTTLPRAFGFGLIWGWMPCGFAYSMLLIAALAADAWHAAATMLVFGLGTVPAMAATSLGAPQLLRLAGPGRLRRVAGVVLVGFAAVTLVAPWLPLHSSHAAGPPVPGETSRVAGHGGHGGHGGKGENVGPGEHVGHGEQVGDAESGGPAVDRR